MEKYWIHDSSNRKLISVEDLETTKPILNEKEVKKIHGEYKKPHEYEIVINTDNLSIDECFEIIKNKIL